MVSSLRDVDIRKRVFNNSVERIKYKTHKMSFLYNVCRVPPFLHVNRIGGVMVSVFTTNAVSRAFEPLSGQSKDYKIGICCWSAKHTASSRKSKNLLARNEDNVSYWIDKFLRGLLFQWASTMKVQLSVLVEYKANVFIILLEINFF